MASFNSRTAGQNSGVSCTATTFAERSIIFRSEAEMGGIPVGCQTKLNGRSTEFLYQSYAERRLCCDPFRRSSFSSRRRVISVASSMSLSGDLEALEADRRDTFMSRYAALVPFHRGHWHEERPACPCLSLHQSVPATCQIPLLDVAAKGLSDRIFRPVYDGMLKVPKLSACSEAQKIKETGEDAYHRGRKCNRQTAEADDWARLRRSLESLL